MMQYSLSQGNNNNMNSSEAIVYNQRYMPNYSHSMTNGNINSNSKSNNSLSLSLSKSNNIINEKEKEKNDAQGQYQTILTIESFPSRSEMIYKINTFLKHCNQLDKTYRIANRDQCIILTFNHQPTSLELLQHITQLSLSNPLYAKTKCSMSIASTSPSNTPFSSSTSLRSNHYKTKSFSNERLKHPRNFTLGEIGGEDYAHRHFKSIREKAGIMTTASPYITEEEKMRMNDRLSSQFNVSKKNFRLCFGQATNTSNKRKDIKNYVSVTPSLLPANFHFRKDDKKKWICKQNFFSY